MEVKVESEKAVLKFNIQKWRSWHPVPSLCGKQMGKKWKQWQTISLGSKITVGGDCSHEMKRCLLPGRKVLTNLDSILKSRDITLPSKFRIVKTIVFSVVMFGCESWTIKKIEYQRIDAFELCHWRRLLKVPWTARRSNQSILKEINPEYSLEGLMLKLKFQYIGHLMWKAHSHGKDHDSGKDWRQEEKGTKKDEIVGWHHQFNGYEFVKGR